MCLTIYTKEKGIKKLEKIAEDDIVCWKILYVDGNGQLSTYFMQTPVLLGKKLKARGRIRSQFYGHNYGIEGGLIHTFKEKNDAYALAIKNSTIAIVKCIIPKGTRYYEGEFDCMGTSYGSKEVIISDKISYVGDFAKVRLAQNLYEK